VNDDGTLGPWQLAGKTPSPVNSCTAAAQGADLLLLDGIYDKSSDGGQVWRASVDEGGKLSSWQSLAPLPQDVRVLYTTATVQDGQLVAGFARLANDAGVIDSVAVLTAPYKDGALGPFAVSTALGEFRGRPQYGFTPKNVFILGGYGSGDGGNPMLAEGWASSLENGKVSLAKPSKALPKPTGFGAGVAVDDWVFVVGGKEAIFGANGRATVYSAHIGADGALGDFSELQAMPQGRTSQAVTVAKSFLYVTGGGFDAGGLDTVYSTRVRF
jgi:hypothetical protein